VEEVCAAILMAAQEVAEAWAAILVGVQRLLLQL
jgi:hypothetical protein